MTTSPIAPSVTVSPELEIQLKALNVRHNEYAKIVTHLKREPNFTELVMFSALWSEHCSYKHTRHLLKTLPTEGSQIAQGPGENAGIINCGDGLLVAFKVESHNHPTYVEPFEGAATGVGGILRDIFTMNARPVALLNALRFGPIVEQEKAEANLENPPTTGETVAGNRYRFSRAISGIAHYGNCMGVPTIGGDVVFDPCYAGNPLVNVMAVGMMEPEGMMLSGAKGVGNPVLYVGSPTGKDGMGGASFASRSIETEIASADRPAVQVGDPFAEKLLLESCLEAFKTGAVVSAQDMGAAGLTCATAEMAAKGELGMSINLDLVPAREPNMLAWEYLASESQERMLFVLEKGREEEALAVFRKWQVPAVIIGTVEPEPILKVWQGGKLVVDLPVFLLTDMAPMYAPTGKPAEPERFKLRRETPAESNLPTFKPETLKDVWLTLLAHPNAVSRQAVYQQYDRHVRNSTLLDSDNNSGGLIRLRLPGNVPSGKALAASLDGNPHHVALEPYQGTLGVVCESARNVAAVGARPLATTDNLNFGDPEDPEVYFQLYFSVQGIKEACLALNTPVTGGNVSLYNLNNEGAILPSPVIGMVGLLNDENKALSAHWKEAGHQVALLGRFRPALGGSLYQQIYATAGLQGMPPSVSLNDEVYAIEAILALNEAGLLSSAQDISVGGLLPTLTECSLTSRQLNAPKGLLGLTLQAEGLEALQQESNKNLEALLFGETHGSFVISYPKENAAKIVDVLEKLKVKLPFATQNKLIVLGEVTSAETISLTLADQTHSLPLNEAWQAWGEVGLQF